MYGILRVRWYGSGREVRKFCFCFCWFLLVCLCSCPLLKESPSLAKIRRCRSSDDGGTTTNSQPQALHSIIIRHPPIRCPRPVSANGYFAWPAFRKNSPAHPHQSSKQSPSASPAQLHTKTFSLPHLRKIPSYRVSERFFSSAPLYIYIITNSDSFLPFFSYPLSVELEVEDTFAHSICPSPHQDNLLRALH